MKYYFITYEETIGEFSHVRRTVKEAADSVSVDDVINDYFGDFYGETTTRVQSGTFIRWEDDAVCAQRIVKLIGIREISKEDYDVLKRYL